MRTHTFNILLIIPIVVSYLSYIRAFVDNNNSYILQPSWTVLKTLNKLNHSTVMAYR